MGMGRNRLLGYSEIAAGGGREGKKSKKVSCGSGDSILDGVRRPELRGQTPGSRPFFSFELASLLSVLSNEWWG